MIFSPDFQMEFNFKTWWKWIFFKALSLLYAFLVRLRLLLFRWKVLPIHQVDRPVVSIGNITVGGTGKTPMIDWCLNQCEVLETNAVVLSRGYKAIRDKTEKNAILILNEDTCMDGAREKFGDEPWLLHSHHPKNVFYVSPKRVAAAKMAAKEPVVIFLDDGMQHLKLHRDLNIVIIDAVSGVGNGQLLPLGPLREPLTSLSRAHAIIFSRTNLRNSNWIRDKLAPYILPETPTFDAQYVPTGFVSSKNELEIEIAALSEKSCALFSGIGNPATFESILANSHCHVIDHLVLADHVQYNEKIREKIKTYFSEHPKENLLLTTEKDWVKLEKWKDKLPEFYYLKMNMVLGKDFADFFQMQMTNLKHKYN